MNVLLKHFGSLVQRYVMYWYEKLFQLTSNKTKLFNKRIHIWGKRGSTAHSLAPTLLLLVQKTSHFSIQIYLRTPENSFSSSCTQIVSKIFPLKHIPVGLFLQKQLFLLIWDVLMLHGRTYLFKTNYKIWKSVETNPIKRSTHFSDMPATRVLCKQRRQIFHERELINIILLINENIEIPGQFQCA